MKIDQFPKFIQDDIIPTCSGKMVYRCLGCQEEYAINQLLYTCPNCRSVLLLYDLDFERLKSVSPDKWRCLFDYRRMTNIPGLKGIYRYHEFIGPIIPIDALVYLGEGHTPMIKANNALQDKVGMSFYFKNDGQNPSASFKDRGMASAFSYIKYMLQTGTLSDILAICASTGDTSASAALYASYLSPRIKSAVLLPHKKVTPQQLSQPLGNGSVVFEIPGVFDDCMKVVESLAETYHVALLNSKNAWRILGQESYSYEIAQDFDYDMEKKVVIVPIGNAGNITAVLSGFLKFYQTGIIKTLPKIIGVQSFHANPVYQYYQQSDPQKRVFKPMTVKPSVAQAAMIGNPVSMPRVIHFVDQYNKTSGNESVFFVSVDEQSIMDWQLIANRHGHIACTHGGETLAGLIEAQKQGFVNKQELAILDSTAHSLKFSGFQDIYFNQSFPEEYGIIPNKELKNAPQLIHPSDLIEVPAPGKPLFGDALDLFIARTKEEIASILSLRKVN